MVTDVLIGVGASDARQNEAMPPAEAVTAAWNDGPGSTTSETFTDRSPAPMTVGRTGRALRRACDTAVSSALLVLLAIPMALIALLVVATSRGGAFFEHPRVGRDGREFRMLKFRSMCAGAHEMLSLDDELRSLYVESDFKIPDRVDPRTTAVGRILRKTSLDELPQLWNIVRGEMSLVGVRPIEADQLALRPECDQDVYRLLRPGLTGLWQVSGRSALSADERLHLDREYVESWSPWNDAKIICMTPLAVLRIHHTH